MKLNLTIFSEIYSQIFLNGSAFGILYGLPKFHEIYFSSKFQFKLIFSALITLCYKLAK